MYPFFADLRHNIHIHPIMQYTFILFLISAALIEGDVVKNIKRNNWKLEINIWRHIHYCNEVSPVKYTNATPNTRRARGWCQTLLHLENGVCPCKTFPQSFHHHLPVSFDEVCSVTWSDPCFRMIACSSMFWSSVDLPSTTRPDPDDGAAAV